jgi:ribosome-associated translation inhibitor RaiA
MRFDIQGLGFPLTAALLDHTERRLRFALTRTSERITQVVVRLGDINGPRGGADKLCRVRVYLEHAPPVWIEDAGADLYAVIERAAERAGRNVAKRVDRLHENVRPARPKPLRSLSGEASDRPIKLERD